MKNNNLKTTITIFSMLLCFGIFAQGPPGGGQGGRNGGQRGGQQGGGKPDAAQILEMLDKDNNDKIDKDEASNARRGKISEDFDEIDTNEDGFIDLEELKTSLNNRKKTKNVSPKKLIKEIDDNGDGTLNELEVAAMDKRQLSKNFKDIDTNQDNELDLEELKVFYTKKTKPNRKKRD